MSPVSPIAAAAATFGYAGFWKRLVAYLIDGILGFAVLWIVTTVVMISVVGSKEIERIRNIQDPNVLAGDPAFNQFATLTLWLSIGFLIVEWLYFSIMESSRAQGTIGKLILGLKVTDSAGNRVSFGRATARFWAKIPSSLFFLAGFILAAFTARKQALHDIIARTFVLVKPK